MPAQGDVALPRGEAVERPTACSERVAVLVDVVDNLARALRHDERGVNKVAQVAVDLREANILAAAARVVHQPLAAVRERESDGVPAVFVLTESNGLGSHADDGERVIESGHDGLTDRGKGLMD